MSDWLRLYWLNWKIEIQRMTVAAENQLITSG